MENKDGKIERIISVLFLSERMLNMDTIYYEEYQTSLGIMTIGAVDQNIVMCQFGHYEGKGIHQETIIIKKAFQQLQEYLNGQRKNFELTYRYLSGTPFQHRVWNALQTIPYGTVASYQDIALKIGSPKAYRAVGNANHHNPIAIFIPCHRVIQANHQLGGYGGGVDIKRELLQLEGWIK